MKRQAATRFKGNKSALPAKRCAACGREMTWRRRWAKNWEQVKYCSAACRRRGAPRSGSGRTVQDREGR